MAEPFRVLIVGTGSIGERHARCFIQTGRARVSLCEIDAAARRAVAERYKVEAAFDDYNAALQAEPQVVVISTPAHLHVPMAIQAARCGAHLLIEKPLSTSREGVERLRQIVNENQIACGVAYVYRANPVLAAMRQRILDGQFGRPLLVVVASGQHFPYYRPAYRKTYYALRQTGGGAIQDALTHWLNAVQWIVGPATRLVADCAHLALEGVEVEDTVHLLARHGEVMAAYTLNQHQAPNETSMTVVCEHGTARLELHEHRWRWTTRPEEGWHEQPFPAVERDAAFVAQANAFLDAAAGNVPPLCSLAEAEQTLCANLAALQSAQQRAWKTIDAPVKSPALGTRP